MNTVDDHPCARRCTRNGTDSELLPARHGAYCRRCFTTTLKALALAPELTEHLRAQCPPQMSRQLQEVYVPPQDAESDEPFNTVAFDAVNHLFRMVVYNARRMALLLGRVAPVTAINSWRDTNGVVLGLPARATPAGARYLVLPMTDWLATNLEDIFTHDATTAAEMIDMRDYLFGVANKWPREDRSRFSDMPHEFTTRLRATVTEEGQPTQEWAVTTLTPPQPFAAGPGPCGGRIALFPPRFDGDPEVIECEMCGTRFSRSEYEAALTTHLKHKRDERNAADRARRARNRKADRADQVRNHLINKYVKETPA
ncbi:MAG: hypothetical protein EPO52_17575 [Herbiconiux sp.]|uniref:hypothetical protein n=1 Tax=Herbiconiux sp. TaxID=1871186 RepID=UPI00122AB0FC|nr:hypothetical protein [Herbiconiux sp.]TAJ46343.1 MAG: hypothetical protein EPO52_17575 [Herbiconiux sp.]